MPEGAEVHCVVHSGEELGFSIKVEERDNFFEMMGDIDLCSAHGLEVLFCRISQSHEGISVLKEGGMGF